MCPPWGGPRGEGGASLTQHPQSKLMSLQFFYPSTEWAMAQPFTCNCGTSTCHGTISGAKDMTPAQLKDYWLSSHIRELKSEQKEPDSA